MPPLSFSDDELRALMHLATPVPIENRSAYLEAVAAALGDMPVGPGSFYRTAASLQRRFVTAPPTMRAGAQSKYR
jgi:hypothetical protein